MHLRHEEQFRVLVVDDERVIADSLAVIPHRNGFTARSAYNGAETIEFADGRRPDVLLSDVVMPGQNGFETARTLLTFLPECRVLLFSGHEIVDTQWQARNRRFEVLTKHVPPRQTSRAIDRLPRQPTLRFTLVARRSAFRLSARFPDNERLPRYPPQSAQTQKARSP